MGENKELYKDKNKVNNKTQYVCEAKNFWENIEKGIVLRECLNISKELVENEYGQNGWEHKICDCKKTNNKQDKNVQKVKKDESKKPHNTEKRMIRCFYFRDEKYSDRKCLEKICKIDLWNMERKNVLYGCNILDYEVPIKYKIKMKKTKENNNKERELGIGNFDLILEYENTNYAVEVKPPNSKETILRMILEILTYDFCNCYNEDCPDDYNHNKERAIIKNNKADDKDKLKSGIYYELGIAFFAGSKQHHQFEDCKNNQDVIKILKKYNISVFVINKDEDKSGYKIEKQNLC